MTDGNWKEYYKKVNTKPRALLVEALQYQQTSGKALDLGCGAGGDTFYLREKGYEVTSIDSSEKVLEYIPTAVISTFEKFNYAREKYDLVNAQFALPFCSPDSVDDVFRSIKESLQPDGLFVGQFFGPNDSWFGKTTMNFRTKEEFSLILEGLKVLKFNEEEKDDLTALGDPHHWHLFHIIAKK